MTQWSDRYNFLFICRTVSYLSDALFSQGLFIAVPLAALGSGVPLAALLRPFLFSLGGSRQQSRAGAVLKVKGGKGGSSGGVNSSASKKTKDVSSSSDIAAPHSTSEISSAEEAEEGTVRAGVILVLLGSLLFYLLVFHSLSNLPMGNKLLYGVHQRL